MAVVLVADDDADIRDLVGLVLRARGHEVVSVGDGDAALETCRSVKPALAVLDIMMPGLTGLEVVREMRGDPEVKGIPVVLLTARATPADVQTGYDAGADDYVVKPFSPKDLGARVEALLGSFET